MHLFDEVSGVIDRMQDMLLRIGAYRRVAAAAPSSRRLRYRLVPIRQPDTCAICLSNLFGDDSAVDNGDSRQDAENSSQVVAVEGCGHMFHWRCLRNGIRHEASQNRLMRCPMCSQDIIEVVPDRH